MEPEAEKVKAQLGLSSMSHGDVATLRDQVNADEQNLSLRLELAKALMAEAEYEDALQLCLHIIEKEKIGLGEEAKQMMLDVFRIWDDESQVRDFRKKLSMLLYLKWVAAVKLSFRIAPEQEPPHPRPPYPKRTRKSKGRSPPGWRGSQGP